jgi:hypothetical protein
MPPSLVDLHGIGHRRHSLTDNCPNLSDAQEMNLAPHTVLDRLSGAIDLWAARAPSLGCRCISTIFQAAAVTGVLMRCGHCKADHSTASEVRACSEQHWTTHPARPTGAVARSSRAPKSRATPPPRRTEAEIRERNRRLGSVAEAVDLLAAIKTATGAQVTDSNTALWLADPATEGLVGYMVTRVREVAEQKTGDMNDEWPHAILTELKRAARRLANDASLLLEGRAAWLTNGVAPEGPVDAELLKRIGPIEYGD